MSSISMLPASTRWSVNSSCKANQMRAQIERAKSLVATGYVKGMDRVSMIRSALKSTFKHSFQAATVTGSDYSLPASDPRPEWKIKLEEQAEKINQCINRQKQQQQQGE
ncbi:hypothetical protein niasHT_005692 [Heterodera trifolii]|uniref:Uncharacterized protein n=1 Tax=Heterodera trifolii TaxID=157864 RepID=A0ABD2M861_9BILA